MSAAFWAWLEIGGGGVMVLVGTYYWSESDRKWTKHRRILVAGSGLLLFFGGIIGTRGWNLLTEVGARQTMAATLAATFAAPPSAIRVSRTWTTGTGASGERRSVSPRR